LAPGDVKEEALTLPPGKKIYFASDFHLGVPTAEASLERERRIVRWLKTIQADAHAVYLLGDIFDFWFEYRHVIPKGFHLFQGKIAELREQGLPICFFTGNHDMWMFDYFPSRFGIPIHRDNLLLACNGQRLLIGHGDGLGPGDRTYKLLKKIFRNRACQVLFAWLHPGLGMRIAHFWSRRSRISNMKREEKFQGEEKEFLLTWCRETEQKLHHDFYIFGHRHLPLNLPVGPASRYVNLGEWVHFSTYAVYDGATVELKEFEK
jgi:UDP-2,3-diacylglucosamine hydrolase